MTSVLLDVVGWSGRGAGVVLGPPVLGCVLGGIEGSLRRAGVRVGEAYHMTGLGLADFSAEAERVAGGLGVLNSYVAGMPGEIAGLDQVLFEAFANGPTQALSKVRADELSTANTPGSGGERLVPGGKAGPVWVGCTPGSLSLDDFAGVTRTGVDPLMAGVFGDLHREYVAAGGGDVGLDVYVEGLLSSGQFEHRGYHPGRDFVSGVLDFTIVWPIYKSISGRDPIRGEDLSGLERGLGVVMAVVDVGALIVALPSGGASLGGAAWLGAAARVAGRELMVNALATGGAMVSLEVAQQVGLPGWACALVAVGAGVGISVVGTKYVVKVTNPVTGLPVGEPIPIDIPTPPGKINDAALARKNINDVMVNGGIKENFSALLDDYATIYADIVNTNTQWKWIDDLPFGADLSDAQRALIKARAVERDLIPDVKIKAVTADGNDYRFADFKGAGQVEAELNLPKELWTASDDVQFKWLDEHAGGRMDGYTWHHTETPGVMQRVPYGIHNITNHNGGRTRTFWCEGNR